MADVRLNYTAEEINNGIEESLSLSQRLIGTKTFDLDDKNNWKVGDVNATTGNITYISDCYQISEEFLVSEYKNSTFVNVESKFVAFFAWDLDGNYLGYDGSTSRLPLKKLKERFGCDLKFRIRVASTNAEDIGTNFVFNVQDAFYNIDKMDYFEESSDKINNMSVDKNVLGKNIYHANAEKGYINVSGVIISNTSGKYYYSANTEVKPNTYYYLYGRTLTSAACIAVILEDGTTAKVLEPQSKSERTYDYYMPKDGDNQNWQANGMFLTPDNAKYVLFNLYFSTSTATDTSFNDHIMLIEVGDEYVSGYDPGEYEAYMGKKVSQIKPECLPIVDNLKGGDGVLSAEQGKVLNEKVGRASSSLKVLLIGSSHGMNTIGQFPILAHNAGLDIVCGNFYQGSLGLTKIGELPCVIDYCEDGVQISGGWYKVFDGGVWKSRTLTTMEAMLTDEKWDVISIQRSASEDMTWTDDQNNALSTFIDYITSKCDWSPKIVFNSGFADTYSIATRTSQQADTETIWSTAQTVKQNFGLDIIPMAKVLQAVRNDDELASLGSSPNKMLSCDTQHLDQGIGMYVSGCVCFNFFFKDRSILANKYLPNAQDMTPFWYDSAKFTAIDESSAKKIRTIVNSWFANN